MQEQGSSDHHFVENDFICRTLKGLWNGEYASVNYIEYYAEGVQSYFNTGNRSIQDDQTLMKRLTLYLRLCAYVPYSLYDKVLNTKNQP